MKTSAKGKAWELPDEAALERLLARVRDRFDLGGSPLRQPPLKFFAKGLSHAHFNSLQFALQRASRCSGVTAARKEFGDSLHIEGFVSTQTQPPRVRSLFLEHKGASPGRMLGIVFAIRLDRGRRHRPR